MLDPRSSREGACSPSEACTSSKPDVSPGPSLERRLNSVIVLLSNGTYLMRTKAIVLRAKASSNGKLGLVVMVNAARDGPTMPAMKGREYSQEI